MAHLLDEQCEWPQASTRPPVVVYAEPPQTHLQQDRRPVQGRSGEGEGEGFLSQLLRSRLDLQCLDLQCLVH